MYVIWVTGVFWNWYLLFLDLEPFEHKLQLTVVDFTCSSEVKSYIFLKKLSFLRLQFAPNFLYLCCTFSLGRDSSITGQRFMVTRWSYCYYWFRTWIISSKVYFDSFTIFFSYQLHLDLVFSYFLSNKRKLCAKIQPNKPKNGQWRSVSPLLVLLWDQPSYQRYGRDFKKNERIVFNF